MTFDEMYETAKKRMNPLKLNKHAKICDAVSVIETASGNVYVGVSLVATCGLGYCAEQSALSQMLNDGETAVLKMLVLEKCGALLPPCGKCVELLTQVDMKNREAQVYIEENKSVQLKDLMPYDWKTVKAKYVQ